MARFSDRARYPRRPDASLVKSGDLVVAQLAVAPVARPRSRDTDFLVERYHRAFDDEMKILRGLLQRRRDLLAGVDHALAQMEARLDVHERLQELRLFPAFEAGLPCAPALFEAWATDALELFSSIDRVRSACRLVPTLPFGAVPTAPGSLASRVLHFADEVQDHLAAEARILSPWAGFGALAE
jgi:hypothetical protein